MEGLPVTLRIGFVGCGVIARAHVDSLCKMPDVQMVAFTDVDPDRAAEAAARFAGAAAYTRVADMLDAQKLDAVYVCVPPHAHGEIELALIGRRIPFFVEKPVGNDRKTPQAVLKALRGKKLITSVGYMMRYRDNSRRVRDHLAESPPVVARGAWVGGLPPATWWLRKDQGGGQLMEQTTHIFDLARYLFGEVKSVFCAARRGVITDIEGYTGDDASICTLTFESGLLCEITSSCAVEKGEICLDAVDRKGRARLEGWNLDLTLTAGNETHRFVSTEEIFLREAQVFVEAVKSGDGSKIESPYADAVKTQMVTCAANESMESGRPVRP